MWQGSLPVLNAKDTIRKSRESGAELILEQQVRNWQARTAELTEAVQGDCRKYREKVLSRMDYIQRLLYLLDAKLRGKDHCLHDYMQYTFSSWIYTWNQVALTTRVLVSTYILVFDLANSLWKAFVCHFLRMLTMHSVSVKVCNGTKSFFLN